MSWISIAFELKARLLFMLTTDSGQLNFLSSATSKAFEGKFSCSRRHKSCR